MNPFKKKSTMELVRGAGAKETPNAPDAARPPEGGAEKPKRKLPWKELSSASFLRTRMFYGLLSILVACGICFGAVPALIRSTTDTVEILTFAAPARAGAQVTETMLVSVSLARYHLPDGAVGAEELRSVLGQYVTTDAIPGDVLTAARLSERYPGDDAALLDIPEGKVAISVSLPNLAQSVSGKLRRGDVIRLFCVSKDGVDASAAAPAQLQYVEVLAATYPDGTDVDKEPGALSGGASNADGNDYLATVTLLADPRQAAALAGFEQNAVLHAALVVRGDDARKAAALAAQERLFDDADDTADASASGAGETEG